MSILLIFTFAAAVIACLAAGAKSGKLKTCEYQIEVLQQTIETYKKERGDLIAHNNKWRAEAHMLREQLEALKSSPKSDTLAAKRAKKKNV